VGSRFFTVGNQEPIISGRLLKEIEGFLRMAEVQCGLDELYRLIRQNAPETGRSSPRTLDAPPEEPDGGRIFRAEEFDALLTDDSHIRLQHA